MINKGIENHLRLYCQIDHYGAIKGKAPKGLKIAVPALSCEKEGWHEVHDGPLGTITSIQSF